MTESSIPQTSVSVVRPVAATVAYPAGRPLA